MLKCECGQVNYACDSVNLNDGCDFYKYVCDTEYLNNEGKVAELDDKYNRGNHGQKSVYNYINQSYKPGIICKELTGIIDKELSGVICKELSENYGIKNNDNNVNKSVFAKSVVHSLHETGHNQVLISDLGNKIKITLLMMKDNYKSEASCPHSLEIKNTTCQPDLKTLKNNSKAYPQSATSGNINYRTLGGTTALQSLSADGSVHLNRHTQITYAQVLNNRTNLVVRHKVSNTLKASVNNEKHANKNSHSNTNGCRIYSKYNRTKHCYDDHHITIVHCNKEPKPEILNILDIDQASDIIHNHRKKGKNIPSKFKINNMNNNIAMTNRFSILSMEDDPLCAEGPPDQLPPGGTSTDRTPSAGTNTRCHYVNTTDIINIQSLTSINPSSYGNWKNDKFGDMNMKNQNKRTDCELNRNTVNSNYRWSSNTGIPDASTSQNGNGSSNRHARHVKGLRCGSLNARSINSKPDFLYEYIRSCDLDLFMICESWVNPNRPDHQKLISQIKGSTYNSRHAPRVGRVGGGIAVFYKKNLKVQKMKPPNTHTFEIMEILVQNNKKKIRLVIIYRPESDPIKNPYTMTECYKEFTELFAYYKSLKEEAIFCGDYNFHMNKPDDDKAQKFKDILETFELKQHVSESTHKEGNTLDLIISNNESSIISHQVDLMISDHCNILFDLDMSRPPRIKKNITYRKTKSININDFKKDIKHSMAQIKLDDNLEDLVDTYNENLLGVLDKHAPKQTKLVTLREKTPWTTEEIRPHKRELRRLERKMKRTKLEIDKQLFKDKKAEYKEFLNNKRNEQYTKLIQENSDDPKNLFNVINKALHKKEDTPLPPGMSNEELANDFNEFFDGKIQTIRDNLDSTQNSITLKPEITKYTQQLTEFRLLSQEEVKKLISTSANKHCELDPIPTWLLKECIDDLLPLITQIINLSLQLGDMPLSLKKAIINPLLKKLGLELIKKNYRPVSNLAFISKLIEKAVASQLIEHLKLNKLYDKFQSAYRTFYSTETALLRVKNDILNTMDNRNVMLLLLLDLSAAFDTIDHSILLNRLSQRCGIKGTCLKWFTSYLSNRTQMVKINDAISDSINVKFGVPQGSVLGPILFTLYTAPLGEIIEECGLKRQIYADDTGIYHSISPTDIESKHTTLSKIDTCIDKIKEFMILNKLKINDDKTIFMTIGTNYWTDNLNIKSINIGNTEIESSNSAKNLGIIFDKELTLQEHVNYVCKKGFYHVKDLYSLRKFLNQKETNTAAHAFVTSILDYGNSLFYGISVNLTEKMQVLQNAAAKAVVKKRKFDHISEDRMKLNWLPVEARIKFKYLLITWKCLHGKAPSYLQELLTPNKSMRAQCQNTFVVPKVNNVTHGGIAFTKAAPILWNALPEQIRKIDKVEQFKKSIKTHLFKIYKNNTHLRRN